MTENTDRAVGDRVAIVIASWFGSGFAPKAPGTVGSLAALPLIWPLLYFSPLWLVVVVTIFLFLAGIWAAGVAGRAWGKVDHGSIVIDEVVGMVLAVSVPFYLLGQWADMLMVAAVSFMTFRCFDIAKPWPVSLIDRRMKTGMGVMLDDVAAGLYAGGVSAALLLAGIVITL
jgi:phosphatidylglycerophosphatase A